MALLGIKRAIECSNGVLTGVKGEKRVAIVKQIKSMRSTKSHFDEKLGGLPKNGDTANLQKEEFTQMDQDTEILSLKYSLHIHSLLDVELNDPIEGSFIKKLKEKIADQSDLIVTEVKMNLAKAYTYQIISARAGWRNYDLSLETETFVNIDQKKFAFKDVNLWKMFDEKVFQEDFGEDFNQLSNIIYKAIFEGENKVLKVEHTYNFGTGGAYIHPSQLIVDDNKRDVLSKELFFINYLETHTAAITSQKIQNMLRKVDYTTIEDKSISFEPFGVDLSTSEAHRGIKNSFYAIKKRFFEDEDLDKKDWYFFIGVIIRGGVLGGNIDSKKEKK